MEAPPAADTLPDPIAPLPAIPTSGLPDRPPAVPDGHVLISRGRLGDMRWRYRIVNGTPAPVTSVHLLLPAASYDSRLVATLPYFGLPPRGDEGRRWPFTPSTWTVRRQPGQVREQQLWVISWLATREDNRLPAGRAMHVDLQSNAQMTESRHCAVMLLGGGSPDHLSFPWDDDFTPLLLAPPTAGRPDVITAQVPFPVFLRNELPVPEKSLLEAEQAYDLTTELWSLGTRFGDCVQCNVRTFRPVVTRLERGVLLYPRSTECDVLMVGRDERLTMNLGEQASIGLQAYSLTYGRRAMPGQVQDAALTYRTGLPFPGQPAVDPALVTTASQILERATRLRPTLTTPLGARYESWLVQWGIWRKLRLLEGQPLVQADLERALTVDYFVPLAEGKKQRLSPLQVMRVARQLWADTEALLYDRPLPPLQP